MAAAVAGVLDGAAGGPASIAIGEAECADGETGAASAVSRTDGAAVVRFSEAGCDPAWDGVTAASDPWLAGVLEAARAAGMARGSAGSAESRARKSPVALAAATDAVRVAADAFASGGDGPVYCTGGLLAATARTICGAWV